ncbi:S8 family serine peptidase [Metallumcola ferriviriculae]|uniref:S8 family serine peptidase n=1 Tax=Metallumcola ferriviriculae TaxID=3039180 RepID=A0AAU0UL05_9FIRM|nr:S8 family serine peptidase [Desulfitibacteraceae bacterium MK1]
MRKFFAIIVIVFSLLSFLEPAAAVDTFSDIRGHWGEKAVLLGQSRGVISGYPDGSFQPERPVTRAEFIRMLVTALGLSYQRPAVAQAYSEFSDVEYNHWAKSDIIIGRESGLAKGYSSDKFAPSSVIRRQEMAALLVRALRYAGKTDIDQVPLNFTDRDSIAPWAGEYVAMAVGSGLMNGYPDGSFKPDYRATRAEAATMLYRLLKYTGGAFDYAGELLRTDGQLMYIKNSSGTVAFSVYRGTVFSSETGVMDYSKTAAMTGKNVSVNLNVYGDVTYGEIAEGFSIPEVELGKRQSWARTLMSHVRKGSSEGEMTAETEGKVKDESRSLKVTGDLMGVTDFVYQHQVSGSGQLVAIVDTGVDASHGDLQFLPDGSYKIADWVDYTNEGRVELTGTAPAEAKIKVEGEEYETSGITSVSGSYRYGFFLEEKLGFDVNFNGELDDRYLVLASDSNTAGVYNVVYVDTNGDGKVAEEKAMVAYRESHQFNNFLSESEGHRFPFVVSELNNSGEMVKLGFDAYGHGTHVAGIVAANGQISGIAPGARLLVIKAVNSSGEVDWGKLEEAVTYAAVAGADIINLSMGYYQDMTSGDSHLARTITELVKRYDVMFTVASGNKGPGIGTMAAPGNSADVVSVGAYISPTMWSQDFQWQVDEGGLWYFSSMGPRKDGMLMPTVVAPGSAISTAPGWAGVDYFLMEGTSMAAPHAAGVAALLRETAADNGIKVNAAKMRRAFGAGAKNISHLNMAEVGNGLLNIGGAWEYLRQADDPGQLGAVTYNEFYGMGSGLYARDFVPGQLPYQVLNYGAESRSLTWKATVDWMKPLFDETTLTAGQHRELPVRYDIPDEPGLYTGLLIGDDPETYGRDLELLGTVIRPYRPADDDGKLKMSGTLGAGQVKRYFVQVPPGTEKINARLAVPRADGKYMGRARIHLVQPNGEERVMTDYAGNAPQGYQAQGFITAEIDALLPGVWEVAVYSSATLSLYGQETSSYDLTVSLEGGEGSAATSEKPALVVGVIPGMASGRETGFMGLTLRDFDTKQPYDGVVEVNGLLYNVRDGRLRLKAEGPLVSVNI